MKILFLVLMLLIGCSYPHHVVLNGDEVGCDGMFGSSEPLMSDDTLSACEHGYKDCEDDNQYTIQCIESWQGDTILVSCRCFISQELDAEFVTQGECPIGYLNEHDLMLGCGWK